MELVRNALTWFEIPVIDFNRARIFYNRIFDFVMPVETSEGRRSGFLLFEQGKGIGGALVEAEGYHPSSDGVRVYLNGGEDLNTVLNRVVSAGGKIEMPKILYAKEIGYIAVFIDSEGNKIGLHSMN